MTATPECRCKIRLSSFVEHPKAVTPNVDDLSSAKGDRENGLLIGWKKCWCPWPDSNQHALRHSILSRARLPISPQGPNRVSGAAFRQAIRRPHPTIRKLAAAAAGDCVWLIPKINCAAGVAGSSRLRQHVSGQPLRTGQDLRSSARRARDRHASRDQGAVTHRGRRRRHGAERSARHPRSMIAHDSVRSIC